MSDSENSLPEFSDDAFSTDEEVAELTKEKPKKVKIDPPLMNRPSTPDEFERYEPVPYQLMAAANDLINGDGFVSLSDPRCILYMKDEPTGKWFEVGKTERIKDTLSPEWVERIDVDFFEGEEDECRVEVYDWNKNATDIKKHTFLGQWNGMFSSIIKGGDFFNKDLPLSNRDNTGPIKKKGDPSTVRLGALPCMGAKVFFKFQFEAVGIDKMSKMGKTDAFLEMAVSGAEEDQWITIHRTEVIKKTVDPQWEKFQLTMNQLASDVLEKKLKISVNHWSKKGTKEVGSCVTTFADLKKQRESGEDIEFVLINQVKKEKDEAKPSKKGPYVNSGIVKLTYLKKKKARARKATRQAAPVAAPAPEDDEGVMTLEIKTPDIEDNGLSEGITADGEPIEDAEEATEEAEE